MPKNLDTNTLIGIILFALLIAAVIYAYFWLFRSEAKQTRAEYPSAKRMTREQKEKVKLKAEILDGKLYSDELFLGN